ncbi:MAG TPA: alpha/beta hydrolase, partial [Acidimicrobiales bacterium]|nr:alpha/beta hydrolase [Acidimicrobiales bacterium]
TIFDPTQPEQPRIRYDDTARAWAPEEAKRAFFHDCTPEVAGWAAANFRRQVWTSSRQVCELDAWLDVEAQYVLCTEDRGPLPEWARRRARDWLGVEAIELPGGHAPMLSRPAALAGVLTRDL